MMCDVGVVRVKRSAQSPSLTHKLNPSPGLNPRSCDRELTTLTPHSSTAPKAAVHKQVFMQKKCLLVEQPHHIKTRPYSLNHSRLAETRRSQGHGSHDDVERNTQANKQTNTQAETVEVRHARTFIAQCSSVRQ